MTIAPIRYPKLIQPNRWVRNGSYPDAWFIRQVVAAINHAQAYRPKVVMNVGGNYGSTSTISAAGTYWRTRFHAGFGQTELHVKLGIGRDVSTGGGPPLGAAPAVSVAVTPDGGSPTTKTAYYGLSSVISEDAPYTIQSTELVFTITANTTYEIAVAGVDYGRPLEVCAYTRASSEVDDTIDYFVEIAPSVTQPIYDSEREAILIAASNLWLTNGAHLMTWAGNGSATAVTQTGTTWLNVIDATSTTISAATPGFYFDANSDGATGNPNLQALCRLKDGASLPCVFAVYANTGSGSDGEVRLADGTGAIASVTGITTSLAWHKSNVTLAGVDSLAKLDLQVRNGTGGVATNIYAAALYTRAA